LQGLSFLKWVIIKGVITVNNKDQILGLLGKNIEFSLSPKIHNYLSNVMGLNYHYFIFDIEDSTDLKKAIEAMRVLKIQGVNVTIPYKKDVMQNLDRIDQNVKKLGAVNTIKNEEGQLVGYNTDVDGFDELAYNKGVNFAHKTVSLIGAGGAAAAVVYYLAKTDLKKLYLINRTIGRAEQLKTDFLQDIAQIEVIELSGNRLSTAIDHSDIIINSTPLGLQDRYEQISPIKADLIKEKHTVIDLVYKPRITKLLQDAKDQDARIISGIEMLIYQAVKSFEIWTGALVEYDLVKELINNL